MKYDYLIVGAGLFGCVFAHEMKKAGKSCLVIEKRDHIAGNIYTKEQHGIRVHQYGAHIFHTSDREVWDYVNALADFNNYINSPVAVYEGELYNLPFNMNTFHALFGVNTPKEAKQVIAEQIKEAGVTDPQNLEQQAISLAGTTVYEKLVKGYTEKQWGRDCKELPPFIIKRLPLRYTYDNNYFNDRYQGIPVGGYTQIAEKLLADIPIRLETEYKAFLAETEDTFEKVLYTGMIDEFFDYCYGQLEYRSLRFESEYLPDEDNSRAMRLSTIRSARSRIPVSLSISILSSVKAKERSSQENILQHLRGGTSRIIRSMMKRTGSCIRNMRRLPKNREIFCLVEGLANINTMIWIK